MPQAVLAAAILLFANDFMKFIRNIFLSLPGVSTDKRRRDLQANLIYLICPFSGPGSILKNQAFLMLSIIA